MVFCYCTARSMVGAHVCLIFYELSRSRDDLQRKRQATNEEPLTSRIWSIKIVEHCYATCHEVLCLL